MENYTIDSLVLLYISIFYNKFEGGIIGNTDTFILMAEGKTCNVCCDTFNRGRVKKACPYCSYECCSKCIEAYTVAIVDDPHCMNCKNRWSNEILTSVTTKTFINGDFYKHRKSVLLNREKSYLAEYQEEAVTKKKTNELTNIINITEADYNFAKENCDLIRREYKCKRIELRKQILICEHNINSATNKLNMFKKNRIEGGAEIEREIKKLERELSELKTVEKSMTHDKTIKLHNEAAKRDALYSKHYNLKQQLRSLLNNSKGEEGVEKKKFVRKCTVTGCNGFLSTAWKCEMCENWSCPDCFEVKGLDRNAEHICNPDNLATAELIRSDTKPCPTCGEMISKIDGCDQMWCISCHTAFSWATGREVKSGIIHNPHYYQWLRSGGREVPRNPLDNPCGGEHQLIRYEALNRILNRYKENIDECDSASMNMICASISRIHRIVTEFIDYKMRRYTPGNIRNEFKELSIGFLLNDINEQQWENGLARVEKTHMRVKEVHDVYTTFHAACIDIINSINVTDIPNNPLEFLRNIVTQLNKLKAMIDKSLKDINSRYKSTSKDIYIDTWHKDPL